MNHQRIYNQLIAKRQSDIPSGYSENHHILPDSMGGSNDPSNMVRLTAREHWVAHLLLFKIHRNRQMAQAIYLMSNTRDIKSSRLYEEVRIICAKASSDNGKKRVGKANGSFGSRWICNVDLQENRKIPKDQDIPTGWSKGRSNWKKTRDVPCLCCGKIFSQMYSARYCSTGCRPTSLGYKHTEAAKTKISKCKKELYKDPTSNPMYGRKKFVSMRHSRGFQTLLSGIVTSHQRLSGL